MCLPAVQIRPLTRKNLGPPSKSVHEMDENLGYSRMRKTDMRKTDTFSEISRTFDMRKSDTIAKISRIFVEFFVEFGRILVEFL